MGKTFILKRKTYGYFGDGDGLMGLGNKKGSFERNMVDGDIWNGPKSKLAGNGMAKGLARGILSPVSVATMVGEQAKGAVEDQLNQIKDTAQTYTPTVQNNYLQPKSYSEPIQKSYGVIQATKEIGTGVGKGIWNYAKQNKKAALGMAGFGAALPAAGWATNRIQRQAAENQEGTRTTDGMSTGGKIAAGLATVGTGAGLAHSAGKSWDKQMNAAQDIVTGKVHYDKTGGKTINTKFGQIQEGKWVGSYDQKKHGEFFKELGEKHKSAVIDPLTGKEVKGADGKVLTEAKTSVQKAKDKVAKLNNKSFLGLKGKAASMAKRGAIGATVVGGLGLLANSMLRQPKKQESAYSEIEQRQYGMAPWNWMSAKVGKRAYKAAINKLGPNAGIWDKTKAVGTGIGAGVRKLSRSAADFMSMGSNGARDLTREVGKSLRNSGEYGKKAADFMSRHKTGTMLVGAGTVGTAGFHLANTAGEKPVEALTKLDKKTDAFTKRQQEMYNTSSMNDYNYQ